MLNSIYAPLFEAQLTSTPSLDPVAQKDTTLTKIFVGGLPYHTNDKSLKDYFERFGEIEEAVVITDRQTAKSKGYGFVTMKDRAGAERACKEPNPIIDGRKANVNLAYLGAKPRANLQLLANYQLQNQLAAAAAVSGSYGQQTLLQTRLGLPQQLVYTNTPLLGAAGTTNQSTATLGHSGAGGLFALPQLATLNAGGGMTATTLAAGHPLLGIDYTSPSLYVTGGTTPTIAVSSSFDVVGGSSSANLAAYNAALFGQTVGSQLSGLSAGTPSLAAFQQNAALLGAAAGLHGMVNPGSDR